MTDFWRWQPEPEREDSLQRRLQDTLGGIRRFATQQQGSFERSVQQRVADLGQWAADLRGPAFTPEPQQPSSLGATFGDTSIGAPDVWPETNTAQQFGVQPQPLPPPAFPPTLPQGPGYPPQGPQAQQQQGNGNQVDQQFVAHETEPTPYQPPTPDFGALAQITASAPGEEARQAALDQAAQWARTTGANPPANLPGPVRGMAAATLPRAAGILERAKTINPIEGVMLGMEASGLPGAALAGAVGLPDRPVVPGVQPETPVLGGLTNPTELAYNLLGPGEIAGLTSRGARVASRGLRAAEGVVTGDLATVAERIAGVGQRARQALGAMGEAATQEAGPLGVIPPGVARQTPGDVRLPQRVETQQLLRNTRSVRVTPEGVEVDLRRYQKPSQAGQPVSREGVYYSPQGTAQELAYRTAPDDNMGEGGSQEVTGRTLFRRPLVIVRSGEGAGSAPQVLRALYPGPEGERLGKDLVNGLKQLKTARSWDRLDQSERLLVRFGFAPDEAKQYVQEIETLIPQQWSRNYALVDAVGARAARNAGYDGILYARGGELQEAIDLREARYPIPGQEGVLRPEFRPGTPEAATPFGQPPKPMGAGLTPWTPGEYDDALRLQQEEAAAQKALAQVVPARIAAMQDYDRAEAALHNAPAGAPAEQLRALQEAMDQARARYRDAYLAFDAADAAHARAKAAREQAGIAPAWLVDEVARSKAAYEEAEAAAKTAHQEYARATTRLTVASPGDVEQARVQALATSEKVRDAERAKQAARDNWTAAKEQLHQTQSPQARHAAAVRAEADAQAAFDQAERAFLDADQAHIAARAKWDAAGRTRQTPAAEMQALTDALDVAEQRQIDAFDQAQRASQTLDEARAAREEAEAAVSGAGPPQHVTEARPRPGNRVFDGDVPYDQAPPEVKAAVDGLFQRLGDVQRNSAEGFLATIRRQGVVLTVDDYLTAATDWGGLSSQTVYGSLQRAGYDYYGAGGPRGPLPLTEITGTSTPEAMGLPAPGVAGITQGRQGPSTRLSDLARDVLAPARAATTAGERAFDVGLGAAGGVTAAATAPEDATWQERVGRGVVGAALGARSGPALRSLGRVAEAGLEGARAGIVPSGPGVLPPARRTATEQRAVRRLVEGTPLPPAPGSARAGQHAALEAGAKPITLTPEKEVARLRLDKFPEWARDTIAKAAEDVGYAHPQRRGVVPDETAEAMADASTRTFEQWVRQGKAGQAYNTEDLRALRNAVTAQAGTLNDLTRQYTEAAGKGEGTDALLARVLTEGEKLQALTTIAEGARAEWGRAGRAFQAATRSVDLPPNEAVARLFKKLGGRDNALQAVQEYQRLIDQGANPVQVAQYWARVEQPPPGFTDWFKALRYNAMLSGPRTFEVNLVGNALEVPWRLLRDTGASAARGRLEEVVPEVAGLWAGMEKGASAFLETLAHSITEEQAIAGDLPRDLASRVRNPVARTIARVLEAPSRVLQAADEFARQAALGMAKGRIAAVRASKAGLRGEAWKAEVARQLGSSDPALLREATSIAERMTYKGEMGGFGTWLQSGVTKGGPIGNLFLPFLRTVYHITARGIDRSPLGIIGTGVDVARGVYRGGKELPPGVAPLGERLGDNVIGGLIGAWFINQALQGNVSASGPEQPGARNVLRAQGWQPYSVRLGDRWVAYSNWGPVAVSLSLAGAAGEALLYQRPNEGTREYFTDVFQRFARLGTEQTYLQSIGAIYRGLTEPDRYGEQFVTGVLSSLVPYGSALNTAAQVSDPLTRRPDRGDIPGAIAARVPGLREQQPALRDVFGNEVPNQYAGPMGVLPVRVAPPAAPDTATLRRYQGSQSAAEDVQIGQAIDRVTNWRNHPREYERPTPREIQLYNRFKGRENRRYQALVQREQARSRTERLQRQQAAGRAS